MINKTSHTDGELHTLQHDQKPIPKIKTLIEALLPWSTTFSAKKGQIFHYHSANNRICYLLLSGSASLHRRGDGIVLNSETAPFIVGVSNQNSLHDNIYLRIREESLMSSLPLERLTLIVEKYSLWEELARLTIYTASRIYDHCMQLTQLSAYEIIRFKLLELMQEPDTIRLNITAANYILNRSFLSRSGIMRIISELKQADFITVERGVLLDIKKLPTKY